MTKKQAELILKVAEEMEIGAMANHAPGHSYSHYVQLSIDGYETKHRFFDEALRAMFEAA